MQDRHGEQMKDRERVERIRLGTAAAAIMTTGMVSKKDGTGWAPWDVFGELQPMAEEVEEESSANGILSFFQAMAAGQKAREESN